MKKIWKILRDHLQEDFRPLYYISITFFLVVSLAINYHYDLENSVIDRPLYRPLRMAGYLLLYSVGYYTTFLLLCFTKKKTYLLTDKKFWFFSSGGLVILAISTGFPYLSDIIHLFLNDFRLFGWTFEVVVNLASFLLATLPLLILSFYMDQNDLDLGIRKSFSVKPYIILLLLIIPFIGIAAFEKGLGNYYPTYKANSVAEIMNWPTWLPVIIYETAYALDFFNVEFLFRGFLVIGLGKMIGKEAIMPMVTVYCFLHFGKPLGEAISSIFGGYALGAIAYYTRSIWGGVIIHMGVALTMEIAAWLAK